MYSNLLTSVKLPTPLGRAPFTEQLQWLTTCKKMKVRVQYRYQYFFLFLLVVFRLANGSAYVSAEPFLELQARRVINLTQAAYCGDQLEGWNCTFCAEFPGMRNVSKLHGQRRNVRGYIGVDIGHDFGEDEEASSNAWDTSRAEETISGYEAVAFNVDQGVHREMLDTGESTSPERVVITFSGTNPRSIKNWMDDLEASLVSHSYANGTSCVGCKVHEGFLSAYEVVQDQVCDYLPCQLSLRSRSFSPLSIVLRRSK